MFKLGSIIINPSSRKFIRHKVLFKMKKIFIVNEYEAVETFELSENKYIRMLQSLLKSTSKTYHKHSVQNFLVLTITIFIASYIVLGSWTGSFTTEQDKIMYYFRYLSFSTFLSALGVSLIPLIIRIYKIRAIRVDNSYSLIDATELFQLKYRSENYDLYFSMKALVKSLNGNIKFAFSNVLDALQTNNPKYVADGIELFIYQINTSWAKQVGIMIDRAYNGMNVDKSLSRINRDMVEIKNNIEEEKSKNYEVILLGYTPAFFAPFAMYLMSVYTEGQSWHYYFNTDLGKKIIILTIGICILGIAVAFFMKRPKYEV